MPLVLGEQPAHRRHLAHLDGVAVEAGQDTVQAEHVAMPDERLPTVEVAAVRLARYAAAQPLKIALDDRAPLLQTVRGQPNREPTVKSPGPPLGAGEFRDHGAPGHLEAVAHAGQQPVELVVAEFDCARQELADTGLMDTAETGQLRLGGARFAHHLAEEITTLSHHATIAFHAIEVIAKGGDLHRFTSGHVFLNSELRKLTWAHVDLARGVGHVRRSDTVGHKSTQVTETVYRHVIVPAIRGGATVMDDVFGAEDEESA